MLKGQDIKHKTSRASSSGKVSCLFLLLLTFLLINPTATSASALEGGEDANYDDQISAQADSGVTISFTPSSGSASLTPTTSDGASAKINVSANVKIASTGGYTIYLGGKNSALTGATSKQTIPAATTATTFANMKTNTWGYAVAEDSSVPDTATYSALPQGQGISLESKSGNQSNIDKTYAISFATKIGNDKPADVYSNQVTLSVTSTPWQITQLSDINEMQSMTAKICEGSAVGDTKQLKDTRDGKYYWVRKMPDNNCWMAQNLDLDLKAEWPDITKTDIGYNAETGLYETPSKWSDITEYTPATTATSVSEDSLSNYATGTRSWSLGDYVIIQPTMASNCGFPKTSLSECPSQFSSVVGKTASSNADFYQNTGGTISSNEYDAHYLVGNHYQWNTATAGTGGTIDTGEAAGSICPKGWKLPTAKTYDSGSFGGLINAGGIGSNVAALTGSGYSFIRGGDIVQDMAYAFQIAGDNGYYWSSTPLTGYSASYAYILSFSGTDTVSPTGNWHRNRGLSVRCIAR